VSAAGQWAPFPAGRSRLLVKPSSVAVALLAVVVAFMVLYPLGRILASTFFQDNRLQFDQVVQVVTAPWFGNMLQDTAIVVGTSGILALCIASVFAWINERTDAGLGTLGALLPIIPLLVPSVAVAIGWVFLLSERVGFLSTALTAAFGDALPIVREINIYSWAGLIGLYTMFLVPYAYLIIASAFKNIDPAMEEASRICGASIWRTMTKVSLPSVMPAVIGSGLLLLIEGMSLYAAPVIIAPTAGIDILSVRMVRMLTVNFPPNVGGALVLSVMMMSMIVLLWMAQRHIAGSGVFAKVSGRARAEMLVRLGPWKWVARAFLLTYVFLASVLPLTALLLVSLQPFWSGRNIFAGLSLQHYQELFSGGAGTTALRNSIVIGVVGASIGMLIAAALAIFNHTTSPAVSRLMDGISKLPAALPHVVVAVGFLIAFGPAPFYLAGTMTILLLAYLVIYLPQASIAATAAASQVGGEMSEASAICGASAGRTFRKILLPLMSPGLIAGWGLLFVLMAGELTAASILANARTPVAGFIILEIFESGSYGLLAALAAVVSLLSATVISTVMFFSVRRTS
jgi:iron(III) transport system permease protein